MNRFDRRTLLKAISILFSSSLVGCDDFVTEASGQADKKQPLPLTLAKDAHKTLYESSLAVGKIWLKNHRRPQSPDFYYTALGIEEQELDESLFSRLQKAHRSDFLVGNTVVLNDWLLSQTEVYLCVLFALGNE